MNRLSLLTKTFYKRVSHVIFDMDGLLLDTECVYTKVIGDIAKKYNKTYTRDVRIKLLGTEESDSCKIAVAEMKLPITWQDFQKEFSYKCHLLLKNCPLLPGVEKFVYHLHQHKVPMAVATSSSRESFEYKTEHLKNFFSIFKHKVTGASDPEVKRGKPSPDIFLVCASRFPDKPKPEQCLVLEDSPNGAKGAIAAGMQCIIIPDDDVPLKHCAHATQIVKSMDLVKPEEYGLPSYKEVISE